MTTQPEHRTQPAKNNNANKTALKKARAEVISAQARIKAEEKSRQKAEEALAECQEDLKVLQADLKREQHSRLEAEQNLVEAKKVIPIETKQAETLAVELVAESSEPAAPLMAVSASTQATKPTVPVQSPRLILSEVQVVFKRDQAISEIRAFPKGKQTWTALRLGPDESVIVQTRFQIYNPGAAQFTAKGYSYEIRIYACEIMFHKASLVASHQACLIKDIFAYSEELTVSKLNPGLYQLRVMIILNSPVKLFDHRKSQVILANQP